MKNNILPDKKILRREVKGIIMIVLLAVCHSCDYNELPPKTDDASTGYRLPKGEVPTAADLDTQTALKKEYNDAVK